MQNRIRHAILASFVAALTLGAADAAAPQPRQPTRFNLPAQPLADALRALGTQTNTSVVFDSALVEGRRAPALNAQLSLNEALRKVLSGTGLKYRFINERTVVLTAANATSDAAGEHTEVLKLAQVAAARESGSEVEEMLVEGERDKPAPFTTANLDLTRTEDDVLPFTVFSARDIELSGATDIEEFLRNRLTQNFSEVVSEEKNGSLASSTVGHNAVNLLGWGGNETVILVNGRRLPKRNMATNSESAEILGNYRGIPLASIERVEILTSAGSAIYGAGATGGVINIITRQDYRGGSVSLGYENAWSGDAPARSVDVSFGVPLRGGVGLRVTGGINESDPMTIADRADVSIMRWRRLVMERQPSRLSVPPIGSTPNIWQWADESLFGTATYTSVPDGYAGGGGVTPFLARANQWNLGLAEGSNSAFSRDSGLGAGVRSNSITVGLDKRFSPEWALSFEYSGSRSKGLASSSYLLFADTLFGQSTYGLTVPASAPVNPFGRDVFVAFDDPRTKRPDLKQRNLDTSSVVTVSLRGAIGAWRGVLDVSRNDNETNSNQEFFAAPLGGWQAAVLNGTYNPFVDIRTVAPADPGLYEEYVKYVGIWRSTTSNYQGMLKLSGPVARLPAGPVALATGVEWVRNDRDSSMTAYFYANSRTGELVDYLDQNWVSREENPPLTLYSSDTYSFYAEVTAPLVAEARRMPLVSQLEMFVSGRTSLQVRNGFRGTDGAPFEYENRPYQHSLGLRYAPVEGVALRASHSIGFKPPTFVQVTPSLQSTVNQTVIDRRRNNQSYVLLPAMRVTGGNPDLRPETTNSSNFGVILQPEWAGNLRLSLNYLHNVRNDAISTITPQNLLDLEAVDPDLAARVQRNPPGPSDTNGVGTIAFIDARQINFREISSRSADLNLDYRIGDVFGGTLNVAAAVTKRISFRIQTSNLTPAVEQVGNINGSFSRQTRWNGNAQLNWSGQRWNLGWSTRYFDSLLVLPADYILQGSTRVGSALNHDLFVGYSFPANDNPRGLQWLTSGLTTTFGIKDVFDREPRFWAADEFGIAPFDSVAGRSLWMRLRRDF